MIRVSLEEGGEKEFHVVLPICSFTSVPKDIVLHCAETGSHFARHKGQIAGIGDCKIEKATLVVGIFLLVVHLLRLSSIY
jgi:hypothetical protein